MERDQSNLNKGRKGGLLTRCGASVQSGAEMLDQFGETFHMKIDKDRGELSSIMGTLFSFLVFVVVVAYTYVKVDVFIAKKDVDIMRSVS